MLPFLIVGSISTVLSILLAITIPRETTNNPQQQRPLPAAAPESPTSNQSEGSEDEEGSDSTPLVRDANTPNGSAKPMPHEVQLRYEINQYRGFPVGLIIILPPQHLNLY